MHEVALGKAVRDAAKDVAIKVVGSYEAVSTVIDATSTVACYLECR